MRWPNFGYRLANSPAHRQNCETVPVADQALAIASIEALYAEFGDKNGVAEAIAVELVERSQAELLAQLAARRLRQGLAGLQLATGELPHSAMSLVRGAEGEEHAIATADDGGEDGDGSVV